MLAHFPRPDKRVLFLPLPPSSLHPTFVNHVLLAPPSMPSPLDRDAAKVHMLIQTCPPVRPPVSMTPFPPTFQRLTVLRTVSMFPRPASANTTKKAPSSRVCPNQRGKTSTDANVLRVRTGSVFSGQVRSRMMSPAALERHPR
jgi:hypothetical protein